MKIDLTKEFPQQAGLCYLNHAAVSPWPLRTTKAIQAFAQENAELGASRYPEWEEKEKHLREQLRQLIHAPNTSDIALVKNTSEGLSMIAYGLPWSKGDEILISNEEFPSNRIVWEALASQGVKVKEVPLQGDDIENHIARHFTDKTKMLAISSVQYASGIRLDLEKLGKLCKQADVLFCVDAIQSLGAYDFNLEKNQADFVIADGHKWLMAPEGLALFYSRSALRENMKVNEYGWHMLEDAGNYTSKTWSIADSARRFECGSPNMLGVHGLSASLSLIEDYGMENIERDLHAISAYLREQLESLSACTLHQSPIEKYQSAIINFSFDKLDSEVLRSELMEQQVICVNRGAGIRFSPHFYTSKAVIDQAIKVLRRLI